MRLILFLIVTFTFQISASTYSQNRELTISVKKLTVKQVIQLIENQSDYVVFYNSDQLDVNRKVTISSKKTTIDKVLSQILLNTNFTYKINEKQIVIYPQKKKNTSSPKIINDNQDKVKVEGTIVDDKGEPLPGVTVIIEGTTTGTISDINGKFDLLTDIGTTLAISFIGFVDKTFVVNGEVSDLTISLIPDMEMLEDIVVVGYGTQKKTTVTGAVSAIKGEELAEIPTSNISQTISGKLSGVSMRPNGGQPGRDDPDIHIRGIVTTGNNRPLIIVDGIKRDNIRQINPNTIESLTILKDAAAVAPYGIGGANGVILITTKKGKSGAPKVLLRSSFGIQNPTYIPDMLNAQDYMKLQNEAYYNASPYGITAPFEEDIIANYSQLHSDDPYKYPDSDFTQLINRNQPMQNHSIEFSGGTDRVTYFASVGYYDQQGVFDPVSYNRYNYNLNLEMKATNTTTVGISIIGTFENTNEMDPGENTYDHIWRAGYKYVPINTLIYPGGDKWGQSAGSTPVGALRSEGYKKFNKNTLLSTISIDQKLPFIKGLSIKGVFSYDPTQETIKEWHLPFVYHVIDLNADPYSFTEAISQEEGLSLPYTYLAQAYNKWQNFTYQAYLNYKRDFGDHSVTALLVAEGRQNTGETFWARKERYQLDIDELDFGPSDKDYFNNGGSSGTGSELGYVYRVSYSYRDKYLLEAAGRYDGHYFFAPGERWGFFPSFSAGWRISEEPFMANIDAVENLKLRGSWGQSGMLAGGPFQYMSGYNLYGNGYVFGTSTIVQGAYTDIEPNSNITWEISTKYDIGVDLNMWKGLLNLEIDYFHEDRTGMLLPPQVTLPVEYGLWLAQENKGVMKNNGFDLTLSTRKNVNSDFEYGISANLSYAKNQMIEVFQSEAQANNPNRTLTGKPFGTPFGYKALGLFSTEHDKNGDGVIDIFDGYNITQFGVLHPGDIMYADLSGPDGEPDGKIDVNDQTKIGYPVYPLLTFGVTTDAKWKNIDVSLFFQGSAMSSINTYQFQTVPFENNGSNTAYQYYVNRWTPEHQDAKYPRATPSPYANNDGWGRPSDFWYVNTSFLRLRTANVGYTLPKSWTAKAKIGSVRLYYAGINLFTISGLKYIDPEMGYSHRETAYPVMKTHTFGLNVNF